MRGSSVNDGKIGGMEKLETMMGGLRMKGDKVDKVPKMVWLVKGEDVWKNIAEKITSEDLGGFHNKDKTPRIVNTRIVESRRRMGKRERKEMGGWLNMEKFMGSEHPEKSTAGDVRELPQDANGTIENKHPVSTAAGDDHHVKASEKSTLVNEYSVSSAEEVDDHHVVAPTTTRNHSKAQSIEDLVRKSVNLATDGEHPLNTAASDDHPVAGITLNHPSILIRVGEVRQGEDNSGDEMKAQGARGKETERKTSAPGIEHPVNSGARYDDSVASATRDHSPSHLKRVGGVRQGEYSSGDELLVQDADLPA